MRRTALTGLLATLVAMVATTAGAALADALGVSFQLPGAPEPIPVAGFGVMTGIWSVVGIVVALVVRRLAADPARRWVQVAVSLTALSLVPPVLTGAGVATVVTLVVLHLVAAVVMIPALARSLAVRPSAERLAARAPGVAVSEPPNADPNGGSRTAGPRRGSGTVAEPPNGGVGRWVTHRWSRADRRSQIGYAAAVLWLRRRRGAAPTPRPGRTAP